jgi:hypothetical protein
VKLLSNTALLIVRAVQTPSVLSAPIPQAIDLDSQPTPSRLQRRMATGIFPEILKNLPNPLNIPDISKSRLQLDHPKAMTPNAQLLETSRTNKFKAKLDWIRKRRV